ncbi:MAG: hypothetical protein IPK72_08970 [Candidatus Eisenbacteria bacterium]|nr:hypothetical protein [Candidatus Eisenbacteria bacterium]
MRVRLVTLSLALLPSLAMAVCRPYDAHMTWLSRTYFGSGEFYYPSYVSATRSRSTHTARLRTLPTAGSMS